MYKVIFADDEMIIRENVSKHVAWQEHGFELMGSFANGKEVIDYLADHSIDLLITDIYMPYMNGMDLCKYIYETYPNIKIILLSGYDDFEYAKKAIRYHVAEYVLKPFTSKEMGELLDRIRSLLDEERQKKAQIDRLASSYHDNYERNRSRHLADLITGMDSPEDSEAELSQLGISFPYAYYCVAVLESNMFYHTDALTDQTCQKESKLVSFSIYQVANELITHANLGIACQDKDYHTLLLFHSNTDITFSHQIQTTLHDIMQQLKELMELRVTIGVGTVTEHISQLPLSYAQAKKAAGQHYTRGENQIICFSDIEDDQIELPAKVLLEDLVHALKSKNETALDASLSKIEDNITRNHYGKEKSTLYLCMGIEMIDDFLSGLGMDGSEEKQNAINGILHAQTFTQAMKQLRTYVLPFMHSIANNYGKNSKDVVMMALDYIDAHYMDSDISLKQVCSYLNMSTSRFSSLFKSIQKETFVDVLTRVRMEHAMDLLSHTNLKNYEIAARVGFSDPHYFGIAFKKATGMTPTEYAKSWQQTEELHDQ